MRKGPLSNKDKGFNQGNLNLNIVDLAKKLDRSENAVKQYVEELADASNKAKPETHTMQLYGRNKKYGVVVMTENASSHSDDMKSKPKPLQQIRKYRDAIHKIREE